MAANTSPSADNSSGRPKSAPGGRSSSLTAVTIDRVLPNSMDAEKAVLGAMMLDPQDAGSQALARLLEEHFYYAPHQVIFREIKTLMDAMQAVDDITLVQRLQDKNLLEEIGGRAYLVELLNHVPTASHAEHYLDIVEEKFLLRRLIGTAHEIITRSFEQQDDVKEWVDQVEQEIFNITAERTTQGPVPVSEIVGKAFTLVENIYNKQGMTGLATGFRDLDRITGGLHPGNVFVIAARPSMGKTSLAMNIAEHVTVDQKIPAGVFSLEMSAEELVKRMLCSRAKVNLSAVTNGFLGENRFKDLTDTASELMKAPLYIDDSPGLTIHQVRARARRMKTRHGIQILVIDYMQLMRAPSRRADSSRQVEIADISAGVKALAKELSIPIIVLSQLNRQPEQREGGKPRLSDLRESGSIEQDADVVGLLVRPEMHADSDEEKAETKGKATLIIAKQRNGPTGDIDFTFRGEYTRFENAARIDEGDIPNNRGDRE